LSGHVVAPGEPGEPVTCCASAGSDANSAQIATMLALIVHRLARMIILRERRAEGHLRVQIILFRQCQFLLCNDRHDDYSGYRSIEHVMPRLSL
jgi:hypothetical protein